MTAPNFPIVYYYPWQNVPDVLLDSVLAEFAANGARELVLCNYWCQRILKEPLFYVELITKMRNSRLSLRETHAPYGPLFDLNCSLRPARKDLIQAHAKMMELSADAGCRTYTIHIGAYDCFHRDTTLEEMRDLADEALEALLPFAQKNNLVIAVENSFEPFNPPQEVMRLVKKFACGNLGCCYDSGHANMMAAAPGKTAESYPPHLRKCWHDQFPFEPDALGLMAGDIVTCHLHDNCGTCDDHAPIGHGTIDWKTLITRLKTECPRLVSLQSEVESTAYAQPVRNLCQQFGSLLDLS